MRRLVLASLACAAALVLGTAGPAQAGKLAGTTGIVKGKMFTDGVLTVGQQETILVTRMRPKFKIDVVIGPPYGTAGCSATILCASDPLTPVPGTAPFRTNGKGRALLTFIVPSTYDSVDLRNLRQPPQVHTFVDGESVDISAAGFRLRHRRVDITVAAAPGAIQIPPAPTP